MKRTIKMWRTNEVYDYVEYFLLVYLSVSILVFAYEDSVIPEPLATNPEVTGIVRGNRW